MEVNKNFRNEFNQFQLINTIIKDKVNYKCSYLDTVNKTNLKDCSCYHCSSIKTLHSCIFIISLFHSLFPFVMLIDLIHQLLHHSFLLLQFPFNNSNLFNSFSLFSSSNSPLVTRNVLDCLIPCFDSDSHSFNSDYYK